MVFLKEKLKLFFSKDLKAFYWLLSCKNIEVFNSWRAVSNTRKSVFKKHYSIFGKTIGMKNIYNVLKSE